MRTTWGIATDRGRVRQINEDAVLAAPPIYLVADGMGGYDAGDVASNIVVEAFRELRGKSLSSPAVIHERFEVATENLRGAVTDQSRAGATVAGVATVNQDGVDYWLIFNIGDSRVYRWQEHVLEQISVDHSVVQELLEAGVIDQQEAAEHPQKHQVTRALASHVTADPDYWLIPSDTAHRILICSDGLTTELSEAEISEHLKRFADAQEAADNLVSRAVAAGGRDNVSVVIVDLLSSDEARSADSSRTDATSANGQAVWDEQLESTTIPRSAGRKS